MEEGNKSNKCLIAGDNTNLADSLVDKERLVAVFTGMFESEIYFLDFRFTLDT